MTPMRETLPETGQADGAPVPTHLQRDNVLATGKTFADAIRLLRKAQTVAVAVPHVGGEGDWSYVAISKRSAGQWLSGYGHKPDDPLYSKLTNNYGHCWLHIGCMYAHISGAT